MVEHVDVAFHPPGLAARFSHFERHKHTKHELHGKPLAFQKEVPCLKPVDKVPGPIQLEQ